jgi:chromosome segregation ATPase
VTDLRSHVRRLDVCDQTLTVIAADVVELTTQLGRLQAHAGGLEQLLSDQDALLAAKERELARLADAVATARRETDRSSKALEDATAMAGDRDAHIATLERAVDVLQNEIIVRDSRLAEVQAELELVRRTVATSQTPRHSETQGHVRFVGLPEGYRLAVSDEPCARIDELVEFDGRSFRVDRIGRSPLPADDRPCVFLTLH